MQKSIKRKVAIAVAALALTAGGGLAYAASQQSPVDQQKELLDNAAKRLNVSPSDLQSALRGALGDQLDAAVKDGKLTQAQADEMKQRMSRNGGLPLFGGPGGSGGPGSHFHGHGPGGPFGGLDAAAKYLGLTEAKLHKQLEAGKSLADVAKAEGKSVDGLENAIKAAAKDRLDEAVAAKRLTQEQADQILEDLDNRVADVVAGKRPGRGGLHGPGHGPGPGPGPWGGPPPADRGSSDQSSGNGSSDSSSSGVTPGDSSSS